MPIVWYPFLLAYTIDLSINSLGLKSLKAGYLNVLNNGVELLVCLLILVTLSRETDTDALWDGADSAAPDELVKLSINAYILGSHGLGGKLLDLLDGTWGLLLEGYLVYILVEVNGVVTGDEIGLGHDGK
eukprot:CAMPEP_0194097648 /NCGR_PEP_ID=MMETSP0149-20130528/57970_1 /TAXON_ID=122233 /ORGANISM="Chaetoceros debilis, Strain MM31A-1" /LENGTH=129 /DNA_ID=CAMNT_0038783677 /DNA_START=132 /DNA_END=521 /DNA_ORIENTATION=+